MHPGYKFYHGHYHGYYRGWSVSGAGNSWGASWHGVHMNNISLELIHLMIDLRFEYDPRWNPPCGRR